MPPYMQKAKTRRIIGQKSDGQTIDVMRCAAIQSRDNMPVYFHSYFIGKMRLHEMKREIYHHFLRVVVVVTPATAVEINVFMDMDDNLLRTFLLFNSENPLAQFSGLESVDQPISKYR